VEQRWEQAIATYSKLITDQITDATLLSKRAAAYIATEQWGLAKADWLRAIEIQPDLIGQAFDKFRRAEQWSTAAEFGQRLLEQKPDVSLRWLQLAPIVVLSGDQESYTALCKSILEQPFTTHEPAERAIKVCLLRAGTVDVSDLPGKTLAAALDDATAPAGFRPWGWSTRALLAYRSNDADTAVGYAVKSEKQKPGKLLHALNLSVLAMAQHELQHADEAQASLVEASQLIPRLNEYPGNKGHQDLLIAEILFREAEAKINGQNTDAAEKATPPDDSAEMPVEEQSKGIADEKKSDDGE
jgi:tetratricopeptide (TPR) repeat protein